LFFGLTRGSVILERGQTPWTFTVPPQNYVTSELYKISADNKKFIGMNFCLVFVELAVLVFLFALLLERDDDEADEDVHHEERDDDDVDYVENCHFWPVVVDRTQALFVRVDALVHQANTRIALSDNLYSPSRDSSKQNNNLIIIIIIIIIIGLIMTNIL